MCILLSLQMNFEDVEEFFHYLSGESFDGIIFKCACGINIVNTKQLDILITKKYYFFNKIYFIK